MSSMTNTVQYVNFGETKVPTVTHITTRVHYLTGSSKTSVEREFDVMV